MSGQSFGRGELGGDVAVVSQAALLQVCVGAVDVLVAGFDQSAAVSDSAAHILKRSAGAGWGQVFVTPGDPGDGQCVARICFGPGALTLARRGGHLRGHFYNRTRRHSSLGSISPAELEKRHQQQPHAA
jgi:hypothetical protein